MAPLKVALLGAGIFARDVYVPLIRDHNEDVVLAAVWSQRQQSVEQILPSIQQFAPSVQAYSGEDGLDSLLSDDQIDGVVLVVSVQVMLKIASKCLAAGKHVLQEKPLAPTLSEAVQAISSYRADSRASWSLAENYRFEKAFLEARESVKLIGNITKLEIVSDVVMNAKNKYFGSDWRRDGKGCPNGFMLDGGVHFFSALRLLASGCGCGEPSEVSGIATHACADLPPPDTLVGWVGFENGVQASMSITFNSTVGKFSLRATGEKGTLEVFRGGFGPPKQGYTLTIQTVGNDPVSKEIGFCGVETEFEEFLKTIRAYQKGDNKVHELDDASRRLMPEEGAKDLALLEALMASSRDGGAVTKVSRLSF